LLHISHLTIRATSLSFRAYSELESEDIAVCLRQSHNLFFVIGLLKMPDNICKDCGKHYGHDRLMEFCRACEKPVCKKECVKKRDLYTIYYMDRTDDIHPFMCSYRICHSCLVRNNFFIKPPDEPLWIDVERLLKVLHGY